MGAARMVLTQRPGAQRHMQDSSVIGYLGPEGTFTQQATLTLAAAGQQVRPYDTVPELIDAIQSGEVSDGVLALENSLEGTISSNLDLLLFSTSGCYLSAEYILSVSFTLFRLPGDDTPLRGVSSHPFGIAQCSGAIRERGLQTRVSTSTARACEELAASQEAGWGAIAPALAGPLYGLVPVASALEDDASAATRFVKLSKSSPAATGRDITTFSFRPKQNHAGSLVEILQQFSSRGVNLTSVLSRPTKAWLGEYIFYVECEGHITDASVRAAVLRLLELPVELQFLGSFPQDARRPTPAPAHPDARLQAYGELLSSAGL